MGGMVMRTWEECWSACRVALEWKGMYWTPVRGWVGGDVRYVQNIFGLELLEL